MLYYNNITKKYENINISDYKNDIHFYELLLKISLMKLLIIIRQNSLLSLKKR